jgi:Tol biopolymer transport system component
VTGGVPEFVVSGGSGGWFTPDGKSLLVWDGKVLISSPPGAKLKDPQNPASFPAGILPVAFAPDGSKWVGNGRGRYRSWIVSYPGGKARELPAGLLPVDWFPDSRHLLLTTHGDLDRGDGVAVWDSESSQTRTVFRGPLAAFASLSPDGKRIALTMGSVNWDIQEFSSNGKWLRDLVATSLYEGAPEWSPTGDRLTYISEELGSQDVWVRDDNGRQRAPILKRSAASRLRFSPDGRRVAMASDHIEVVGESGGNSITVVARQDVGYAGACWSPDGRSIAFTGVAMMGSASEVGVVDSNGAGQPAVIAKGDRQKYAGPCRWTPDGQSIFIAGSRLVRISLADKSESMVPAQTIGSTFIRDFSADASRLYVVEQGDGGRWRLVQIDTATVETVASSFAAHQK